MMGQKAIESARLLVRELQLEGQLSPEDFLVQREHDLDLLFPTAQLLPGDEAASALMSVSTTFDDAGPRHMFALMCVESLGPATKECWFDAVPYFTACRSSGVKVPGSQQSVLFITAPCPVHFSKRPVENWQNYDVTTC